MQRLNLGIALLFCVVFCTAGVTAQIHFTASLTSSQENPPLSTSATGTASITLTDDFSEVRYVITFQGLTDVATGAHFHLASTGVNGPVVKGLAPPIASAGTFAGSWKTTDATQPLTTALIDSLLTGRLYVNFHTAANPGGELRGQVNLATSLHFVANISAANESPSNGSKGTGTGVFVLSPDRTQLQYSVTYRGLSGSATGGHIHVGAAGVNGPVVKGYTLTPSSSAGTVNGFWKSTDVSQTMTPALVDSLIAGHTYTNFHTASFPGGEIRGQILLTGGVGFLAMLTGGQENPPVANSAVGTGSFVLDEARSQLSWTVTYTNLSGPLTGGHIHIAGIGRNGPVVKPIATTGDSSNATISGVWKTSDASSPLTATLIDSLLTNRGYVNFHTSTNPGGELRGQLNMSTGVGFTAQLNGSQEPSNIVTTASGTGSIVINPTLSGIHYDITYTGLSGTLSAGGHFHVGAFGVNGPVVKPISTSGAAASASVAGDWTSSDTTNALTPALVDSLIAGKMYVNFHTATNPGGEIRGQLLYEADVVITGVREPPTGGGAPARFALDRNYPNPFNPSTNLTVHIGQAGMVRLTIFDILGREVATLLNEPRAAGTYTVRFDARGLASGYYFARLQSGGAVALQKMVLLK